MKKKAAHPKKKSNKTGQKAPGKGDGVCPKQSGSSNDPGGGSNKKISDKNKIPDDFNNMTPSTNVIGHLHLAMCKANNLSADIGNCSVCANPDACEKMVNEVAGFIATLHKETDK